MLITIACQNYWILSIFTGDLGPICNKKPNIRVAQCDAKTVISLVSGEDKMADDAHCAPLSRTSSPRLRASSSSSRASSNQSRASSSSSRASSHQSRASSFSSRASSSRSRPSSSWLSSPRSRKCSPSSPESSTSSSAYMYASSVDNITYHLIPKTSERDKDKLFDNHGYMYLCNRRRCDKTYWRCFLRNKTWNVKFSLASMGILSKVRVNIFTHHLLDAKKLQQFVNLLKIKERKICKSASSIVEEALLYAINSLLPVPSVPCVSE